MLFPEDTPQQDCFLFFWQGCCCKGTKRHLFGPLAHLGGDPFGRVAALRGKKAPQPSVWFSMFLWADKSAPGRPAWAALKGTSTALPAQERLDLCFRAALRGASALEPQGHTPGGQRLGAERAREQWNFGTGETANRFPALNKKGEKEVTIVMMIDSQSHKQKTQKSINIEGEFLQQNHNIYTIYIYIWTHVAGIKSKALVCRSHVSLRFGVGGWGSSRAHCVKVGTGPFGGARCVAPWSSSGSLSSVVLSGRTARSLGEGSGTSPRPSCLGALGSRDSGRVALSPRSRPVVLDLWCPRG